jgi:hypothetical protein
VQYLAAQKVGRKVGMEGCSRPLSAVIVAHCDFWCGIRFTSARCRVDFFQYRGKSLVKKLLNILLWALLWVESITTKYVDI